MLYYMNDKSEDIADVFDEHIKCELVDKNVDATMKTMVKEPYVHLVPVLTGGKGYNEVYNFRRAVRRCCRLLWFGVDLCD
jgi:hypothetical protein